MKQLVAAYRSTLGKKLVVAVTGVLLFGFVIGHMAGNLKTFAGVGDEGIHKLDHYADFLRIMGSEMFGKGNVLWIFRIGLLGALVLHVATVFQLEVRNRSARPIEYSKFAYKASSLASRSMLLGGIVILAFVLFHLAHLTFGWIEPDTFEHGHVYANVFHSFQKPLFVAIYVVALLFLGLHLYHGLWSLTQTLGIDRPDRNLALRSGAKALAIIITIGFMAVPVGIIAGITMDPPTEYLDH